MWGLREDGDKLELASARPEVAARTYLGRHATKYGLSLQVVRDAQIQDVHALPGGASIVSFRQAVDGLEVYGARQSIALTADRELVAISGSLHSGKVVNNRFALSERKALAHAVSDRFGETLDEGSFEELGERNGYDEYNFAAAASSSHIRFVDNATIKKVYMPVGDSLEAAFFVEFIARTDESSDNDGWRYIVSAKDGSVLERMSITHSEAFNYRVYADASGTPADGPQTDYTPHGTGNQDRSKPNPHYALPNLVAMEGFNTNPTGGFDPWLDAAATETVGNNVDAYTDSNSAQEDGFTPAAGDVRGTTTSDRTFDHFYDPTKDPQYVDPNSPTPVFDDEQRKAAVTQLFYVNNWLHDYWYDSGFNEAAGNAQLSNFGRGGVEGDPLKVEAQDDAPWGTRNNANMSTRAEGTSPRMQMYLWSGVEVSRTLTSPTLTFAGPFGIGTWGPQNFDLTATAALGWSVPVTAPDAGTDDDGGTTPPPAADLFGCGTVSAAVSGKIAVVEEGGGCSAAVKVTKVQAAGAVGMIVVSTTSPLVSTSGRPNPRPTIPTFAVNAADGALIKTALQSDDSALSLTMKRVIGPENDGTIDNTISAHEWGHYFHLRLVRCGNTQCGAMSEGWGDYVALHMLAREGDNLEGAYPVAAYAGQGIEVDPFYFGIRRAPYSVDFRKNALTFRHIQAGEPLPTTAPMSPSTNPNNEVHAAGEIWTSMMHEVHVAMLKESQGASPRMTWTEAHRRVANYIVAGMKMAPASPTYTDQRDAILAAAAAVDKQDLLVMAKAFARRGAGTGAKSPPQNSSDLVGVVESFSVKGDLKYLSATLDDSVKSCDGDGFLDAEEEGILTIKIANSGVNDLTKTQVMVQTPVPGVTLENGGVVSVPTLAPFAQATVQLKVSLDNTFTALSLLPLSITLTDPDAFTANQIIDFPIYVNRDNVPAASSSDDVESDTPVWGEVHLPLPLPDGGVSDTPPTQDVWFRERTTGPGANNQWHGQGIAVRADEALVSPTLNVAATGNLVMTFRHAHSFEANTTSATPTYYDGAVIEYTEDDGASWIDVATLKDPGYNATLSVPAGGVVDNPLQGRQAFGGISANFPSLANVSLNLGTALAGKSIKVRFRIGTDTGTGSPGWFVDNIGFAGITNKPFPAQQADNASCGELPIANAGRDQTAYTSSRVTLNGSASSDPVAGPAALSYSWEQVSGPTVVLAKANTARPSFVAPTTAGTLTFKLRVSDSKLSASDTVNVVVRRRRWGR
jgi:hypothetical protein